MDRDHLDELREELRILRRRVQEEARARAVREEKRAATRRLAAARSMLTRSFRGSDPAKVKRALEGFRKAGGPEDDPRLLEACRVLEALRKEQERLDAKLQKIQWEKKARRRADPGRGGAAEWWAPEFIFDSPEPGDLWVDPVLGLRFRAHSDPRPTPARRGRGRDTP